MTLSLPRVVLLLLASSALCSSALVKKGSSSWISDKALQEATLGRTSKSIPQYKVNLDLAPEDRWLEIASLPAYAGAASKIISYFKSAVPKKLLPLISKIGKDVEPYFGPELGGEMNGLASAFKIDVGYIVAVNLVMQLESIGINCSSWNNTGPTIPDDPGCMDVDPKQDWCYCHKKENHGKMFSMKSLKEAYGLEDDGPGMCTSVVVENEDGTIYHGRNLDWNIPASLREMIADVDYQRNNKTVFTGTTVVGFVGVFNGMKSGVFSASIDARGKGGKILTNFLQALLHKSKTPSQHLRAVLSDPGSDSYENAVSMLASGHLIDENYYIVGGTTSGEGCVVSRGRNKAVDIWRMNTTNPTTGWWRLETNYDHWNPTPKADDRRTPGNANVLKMGKGGIGEDGSGLFKMVITQWPTFNHHTDYTGIYSADKGLYRSYSWTD